jgi:hypothetical protein
VDGFIQTVIQASGTDIPDVWEPESNAANVAGELRAQAATLRFSLVELGGGGSSFAGTGGPGELSGPGGGGPPHAVGPPGGGGPPQAVGPPGGGGPHGGPTGGGG